MSWGSGKHEGIELKLLVILVVIYIHIDYLTIVVAFHHFAEQNKTEFYWNEFYTVKNYDNFFNRLELCILCNTIMKLKCAIADIFSYTDQWLWHFNLNFM